MKTNDRTLEDDFAIAAMQSLLSQPEALGHPMSETWLRNIPEQSYEVAAAMIKHRESRQPYRPAVFILHVDRCGFIDVNPSDTSRWVYTTLISEATEATRETWDGWMKANHVSGPGIFLQKSEAA